MKRAKTRDNRCDSGKPNGYHHNHGKPYGYHHDGHHYRESSDLYMGSSDGSHYFSGKPHGYHQGKGGYPRRQDGSLSRHHHPVMNAECVAGFQGKSNNYHPENRQHNSVDSATKFGVTDHNRDTYQNEGESSSESHLMSSPAKD